MRRLAIAIVAALSATGCTTPATEQAIRNYEDSQQYQRLAFNNAYRIADEQMRLNINQFLDAHKEEPELVKRAVNATAAARRELEEARNQYNTADSLSRLTVGQYLYDQQGPFNVMIEDLGSRAAKTGKAATSAKDATGLGLKDLVPKVDDTSRPPADGGDGASFDEALKKLKGK